MNATKSDVNTVGVALAILLIAYTMLICLLNNKNTDDIINEINASKRLKQIEDRAYQQHNPETQQLLDYVVFGESQI